MENFNFPKFFGLFNFCVITSGTLRCGLRFGCRGTGKNFGKKKVGVFSKKKKKKKGHHPLRSTFSVVFRPSYDKNLPRRQ